MTKETLEHIRAILEWYADSPSGKESDNALANRIALDEIDDELLKYN